MITIKNGLAVLSLIASFALAAPVVGQDDDDVAEHEAFRRTTIALATAVAAAEAQTGARAISAEFARDDGKFIYEVELLAPDGTELEAEVDAQTATVLEVETEDEGDDEDAGSRGRDNDED